jgi:hypothetical protein
VTNNVSGFYQATCGILNPFIFINEKRRDIQAEVATDLKLLSSAEGVCGLANGGNQPLVSAQVVYDLDGGGGGGGGLTAD